MDIIKLKNLHCPHNWGFDKFRDIEEHLLKKEKGWNDDEEDYLENTKYGAQIGGYKTFCLLSYEAFRKKKYLEALNYLTRADVSDDFMDKYSRVFNHVRLASKVHVLYAMKSTSKEVIQILDDLSEQKFSEVENAVINYIKCGLKIGYGKCDSEGCVELIESALQVVPDEPEFHFLLGVVLSRIRHYSFPSPPPSTKEFDALRQAVSLRKDLPLYAVALARLYMDFRHKLPFQKRQDYTNIAESIYRNLLKYHDSLSGNDIARCVFNLTKIKCDPELEVFAKMALKKSNSVLVNHYIGTFYLRTQQYEEAYACFDSVGDRLPYITGLILLLIYRINGNTISENEIEPRINLWSSKYESSDHETKDRLIFHLNISQFYLIVKQDLETASLHFLKASTYIITERNFINLSQKYLYSNYLAVLKNQLIAYNHENEIILKAKEFIYTLSRDITSEINYKGLTPSLLELQNNLM